MPSKKRKGAGELVAELSNAAERYGVVDQLGCVPSVKADAKARVVAAGKAIVKRIHESEQAPKKRVVTIQVAVDVAQYHRARNTPAGAIALVVDMLRARADLPPKLVVSCEGETRTVRVGI